MSHRNTNAYWIIPPPITQGIIDQFGRYGDRKTYLDTINNYIEKNSKNTNSSLWVPFVTKKWEDPTTLYRALNLSKEWGVFLPDGRKYALNLLCCFAFNLNWDETLARYNIEESGILKRRYYKTSGEEVSLEDSTQSEILSLVRNIKEEIEELKNFQEKNSNEKLLKEIEKLINEKVSFGRKLEEYEEVKYKDTTDQKPNVSYFTKIESRKGHVLLSAKDALRIANSVIKKPADVFSISQEKIDINEYLFIKRQPIDGDARNGKSRIWAIEYIDKEDSIYFKVIISDSEYFIGNPMQVDASKLYEYPCLNIVFADSDIAIRNATNFANEYRIINELLNEEYLVQTKLAYWHGIRNGFAWKVCIYDKSLLKPICTIFLNPQTGKITLPYPQVPVKDPIGYFIELLVQEIGYKEDDPEIMYQIKKDTLESIEDRLNATILHNLPEELLPEFENLLDYGSDVAIMEFAQRHIPNLQKLMIFELLEFRKEHFSQE